VIWNYALGVDAIIVTKDEDFAERTARTTVGPVIVWLRIGTLRTVPFWNGSNRVGLLSFNS
jgi:predicted nuclease of predicted toxin-antitoxin system